LIEVPATAGSSDELAVVVSGAGGWAGLDRSVARQLAASGIPVVGLDSRRYLWTRRSPDESGEALARILGHYREAWGKDRFVLIGYSLGASMLPFMASRLPVDLRRQVALVGLIGPDPTMDFELHITDFLGAGPRPTALGVTPEIAKLTGMSVRCVFGATETDSLCRGLDPAVATPVQLPGGHHFSGDYGAVAQTLLTMLRGGQATSNRGEQFHGN
jgi:type IV secretory pathway VirJ component